MRSISLPGRIEFIILVAVTTMIVSFAIDSMLPALPDIGDALGVREPGRQALIISVFVIGMGVSQLFVGTISDRFGRRVMLLGGFIIYAVFSLSAALSTSFIMLLIMRALEGAGAAIARVVIISTVRDQFAGRDMAQVMSLAAMTFMAAPILAPSTGSLILLVAPWRYIFVVLSLLGMAVFSWVFMRLPETLPQASRREITPIQVAKSISMVLRDRAAVGYTIGVMCMQASILAYLTTVQPIYGEIFHRPNLLAAGFAASAATMAIASLINSRVVMVFGMRKIGHGGLIGFIVMASIGVFVCGRHDITIPTFIIVQSLMLGCFSLTSANFSAMAMEQMGEVAGTASSLQGFFGTVGGAIIGSAIGTLFNGTMVPYYLCDALLGCIALLAAYITEGGSLFVPHRGKAKASATMASLNSAAH